MAVHLADIHLRKFRKFVNPPRAEIQDAPLFAALLDCELFKKDVSAY